MNTNVLPSPPDLDPATRAFIAECHARYRHTLLDDIVPFWLRHGVDREHGGIGNVIDDSGRPLGHDKFLWSQGRALWTFATLYTRVAPQPEWLEFAHHIYRYISTHGRDAEGRWMWRLDPQGNILERDISIYVDGFAMTGLTAYHQATGHTAALDLAKATWQNVRARLARPDGFRVAPYDIPPGLKTHGIAMIYAFVVYQLGVADNDAGLRAEGLARGRDILDHFYSREDDAIVEFVHLDGRPDRSPAGRACVMGHALEALWFLIALFEHSGDTARIPECIRLIRRHLELAWDDTHGGLMLARDIKGQTPVYWQNPTCKVWWVHAEALVATAYAFRYSGEAWTLDWHRRIRDYAFAHFPAPAGEWIQWLDREGRPMARGGLPLKDPFHLPRALMVLLDLFATTPDGARLAPRPHFQFTP